ncbi:hypothetical protein CCR75_006974 [Bremia lactucae]|uniref:Uncharacterized protein n=1 Tax=Bremia lactucae TaxID=4779 RepID=A0A976FLE1_BRELC|nr:hypothetical protein CCR75_006974 [Bremia lactucae]
MAGVACVVNRGLEAMEVAVISAAIVLSADAHTNEKNKRRSRRAIEHPDAGSRSKIFEATIGSVAPRAILPCQVKLHRILEQCCLTAKHCGHHKVGLALIDGATTVAMSDKATGVGAVKEWRFDRK